MIYKIDQSYTSGQDNTPATGIGNLRRATNNNVVLAQSFTPSVSAGRNRVDLYLKKIGSPSGNIWVEIHPDAPDPTAVSKLGVASVNVDVSTIDTSFVWVPFLFSKLIQLNKDVLYWYLLYGDYPLAIDVGVYWGIDTSLATYPDGQFARYGNGSAQWDPTTVNYDGLFKEYYQPNYSGGII